MNQFVDLIFSGPEQILRQAISYLNQLSTVAATGIRLSDYVSWIGVLDPAYQGVVDSLLASMTFIAVLFVVRATYRAYLSVKQGVKWW